ncbi:MAG: hypothetical protein U1F67_08650 [Rubrivivax sp.]
MKRYLNARGFAVLKALDDIAAAHDEERATPAQVALAWQIARPGITAAEIAALDRASATAAA